MAIGVAATLWLAASGRLDWYIHPKYVAFTVIMSVIGALATVTTAVLLIAARRSGAASAFSADVEAASPASEAVSRGSASVREVMRASVRSLRGVGSLMLIAMLAGALLVLPPQTLTAATATQRSVNASLHGATGGDGLSVGEIGDGAVLGVREWSQLLFTDGGSQLIGIEANLEGFVSPDPDPARSDIFYVTRFVVTHCVIDVQPVGVPVLLADWRTDFAEDDWVTVSGAFAADQQSDAAHPVVLIPATAERTPAPENPYVF